MKVQEAVETAINPIIKLPILDGVILQDLVITTSAQKFPHYLGRQPQGWWPVDKQNAAHIFRTDWTTTTITLEASATVTGSIWIY